MELLKNSEQHLSKTSTVATSLWSNFILLNIVQFTQHVYACDEETDQFIVAITTHGKNGSIIQHLLTLTKIS